MERHFTFLFFLFLDCALAEGLPPRSQVTPRRHRLVRWHWSGLRVAVTHARRMRVALHRSRHGRRAAERRSSLCARISRAVNDRCVLRSRSNPGWARRVGLQAAEERGHSVTSQCSKRRSRRPAGLAVVLQEAVGAEVRAERRCRGSLGGCSAARAGVQSGAGTLRAREQRDVVAAAVRCRCDRLRKCQAAGWREREEAGLRLETCGDSDVKCAGLGAAEGNDRSSGW